ncbi:MAG TPA: cupin domain-containing protein [Streptosporangiaceae bacterium]|nr:cupin domain-containing protein [Streptosporangiaceae bacterium]
MGGIRPGHFTGPPEIDTVPYMTVLPRRVVTGHDEAGKSVFLSDGVPPVSRKAPDGAGFHELWSTPAAPAPLNAAEPDPAAGPVTVPPPERGTKIRINSFPPGVISPVHRTESVDYGIVIDGEMVLVLDDDAETILRPGDVVIQRGTSHRWENRASTTARMVFVLVDAEFSPGLAQLLGEVTLLHDPLR